MEDIKNTQGLKSIKQAIFDTPDEHLVSRDILIHNITKALSAANAGQQANAGVEQAAWMTLTEQIRAAQVLEALTQEASEWNAAIEACAAHFEQDAFDQEKIKFIASEIRALKRASPPQPEVVRAGEPEEDQEAWITPEVERHLVSQYEAGRKAGWNAAMDENAKQVRFAPLGVKMPDGSIVCNVYEAFEAGKRASPPVAPVDAEPVAWIVECLLAGEWVPQHPARPTKEAAEFDATMFKTPYKRVVPLYASIQSLPRTEKDAETSKDKAIRAAYAKHGGKWPEELCSGVMFYEGERIIKSEIAAIAQKESGR